MLTWPNTITRAPVCCTVLLHRQDWALKAAQLNRWQEDEQRKRSLEDPKAFDTLGADDVKARSSDALLFLHRL